eukprot:14332-Pyramimonas_sp.AAC.1
MGLNVLATDDDDKRDITWDGYMSMSNVRPGSLYMSVNVVFSYIITFFTLWRLVSSIFRPTSVAKSSPG